ncbi:MAG: DUF3653 domain-containing protein [bacterium]|nr:DUF3653 domain-containing protein [bacterium]
MPWADCSWAGFRVRGSVIVTPEGRELSSRDLGNLHFLLSHRESLRSQVAGLRERVAALEAELRYAQIPLLRA